MAGKPIAVPAAATAPVVLKKARRELSAEDGGFFLLITILITPKEGCELWMKKAVVERDAYQNGKHRGDVSNFGID